MIYDIVSPQLGRPSEALAGRRGTVRPGAKKETRDTTHIDA